MDEKGQFISARVFATSPLLAIGRCFLDDYQDIPRSILVRDFPFLGIENLGS
jgi:hypothetical protein